MIMCPHLVNLCPPKVDSRRSVRFLLVTKYIGFHESTSGHIDYDKHFRINNLIIFNQSNRQLTYIPVAAYPRDFGGLIDNINFLETVRNLLKWVCLLIQMLITNKLVWIAMNRLLIAGTLFITVYSITNELWYDDRC